MDKEGAKQEPARALLEGQDVALQGVQLWSCRIPGSQFGAQGGHLAG
jgi:hypothetical protein